MDRIIGVSQRVMVIAEYHERRDGLDQKWTDFLAQCQCLPVFLPNHPSTTRAMLQRLPFDGFLLTGGNNLASLGGDAPERDETERIILEFAIEHQTPLLGVCRGMQFIQSYFGVALEKVSGHVACTHEVWGSMPHRAVNSYHHFGARDSNTELLVTSRAEDGVIESIRHVQHPIEGVMWHPERVAPFDPADLQMLDRLLATRPVDRGSLVTSGARIPKEVVR